ncbi:MULTISPECIES: hypothetical protein [unclassified Crossiella]|uniref:hypothetical protein n=1 Tax=unclassified Crossiella TaxID=2620835 RepID=UPI001FFFD60C|nr:MULTISPECIES: hypothetical protein [unclassified Crossiella]MCK2237231.1 hypothetical protein [Crossiella sp. S99.2]MCK2250886.1 hypothetical protein [Crossiella sp. S99.1]
METTRLLDAALRKAAAVWIAPHGLRATLVWALWRDGAVWVAVGGGEQEVPGLTDGVGCTVTVRSPSTHSHLTEVPAVAHLVEPDPDLRAALAAARLNAEPRYTQVFRVEPT